MRTRISGPAHARSVRATVALASLLWLSVGLTSVDAATPVTGTVRAVSGQTVTVETHEWLPVIGEPAEIFFKLADAGEEISVATGRVDKVKGDAVEVKIENATGEVGKGQLVRIASEKPQKRSSPPSSSEGRDPSFAFADLSKLFANSPQTKVAEAAINAAKNVAKEEYDERLAAKKADTDSWRADKERELQEEAVRRRTEIVADIATKVKETAGDEVSFIADSSGNSLNGVPLFFFTPTAGNINERALAALNGEKTTQVPAQRGFKIALVNLNDVFGQLAKTKEAEAGINAVRSAAKTTYDERTAYYQKELRKAESLSGAARTKAMAQVKTLETEINSWRAAKEKELADDSARKRQAIVADITAKVGTLLAAGDRAIVLDASGNSMSGTPFILHQRAVPDFSSELVAALNGASPSSTNKPALASTADLRFAVIDLDRAAATVPGATQVEERRRAVTEKVLPAIRSLGETSGYNLIFDRQGLSANRVPFLISTGNVPDLTEEVIARLK